MEEAGVPDGELVSDIKAEQRADAAEKPDDPADAAATDENAHEDAGAAPRPPPVDSFDAFLADHGLVDRMFDLVRKRRGTSEKENKGRVCMSSYKRECALEYNMIL